MLEGVVEYGEVSARLMWVKVKFGGEFWVFVSAYGPGSERSEEEREAFWSELAGCVEERKRSGCQVIVLGDLNARVGNEEVHGVMGKYGVPGKNISGDRLLEMCSEMELVVGNTFFRKKGIPQPSLRQSKPTKRGLEHTINMSKPVKS